MLCMPLRVMVPIEPCGMMIAVVASVSRPPCDVSYDRCHGKEGGGERGAMRGARAGQQCLLQLPRAIYLMFETRKNILSQDADPSCRSAQRLPNAVDAAHQTAALYDAGLGAL